MTSTEQPYRHEKIYDTFLTDKIYIHYNTHLRHDTDGYGANR